jgi:hypothetical protein
MYSKKISLKILPGLMAVCRLDPGAKVPDWIDNRSFYSITRTPQELSVVCRAERVPPGAESETGWRCFQLLGSFNFSELGIISSLTQPLAASGVPVFVISSFTTDYLMVKAKDLGRAIDALTAAGHRVKIEG